MVHGFLLVVIRRGVALVCPPTPNRRTRPQSCWAEAAMHLVSMAMYRRADDPCSTVNTVAVPS